MPDTPPSDKDLEQVARLRQAYAALTKEISRFIVGQEEVVEQLLIAVMARGHCLLEGVPGLAKTAMVHCLAEVMELRFRRIQFTPDLMPADITGTEIIQEDPENGQRRFVFQEGPIFTQMLLADEINRTPPKTQAALLEAMQERRVTVGHNTYDLAAPFFVLATQNPIEQEGTYPLPEAQQDRFMFHVKVDYPTRDEEREILHRTTGTLNIQLGPVISGTDIIACQQAVRGVPVPDHVTDFILDLVRRCRPKDPEAVPAVRKYIEWGPGPRAGQMLTLGSKVRAVLQGRHHATVEDVIALSGPALRHRLVPNFNAEAEGLSTDDIIARVLEAMPSGTPRSAL